MTNLIISVRKANGKIAQPTIDGVPGNNSPVILNPQIQESDFGGIKEIPRKLAIQRELNLKTPIHR